MHIDIIVTLLTAILNLSFAYFSHRAHSGGGSNEYEDRSGMMGVSYSSSSTKMCFNGVKNWQLGWYDDKTIDVAAYAPTFNGWIGQLKEITDYNANDPQDYFVVVRLQDGADDYYVHFNRDTSFNSGTKEGGDQVLIAKCPTGNGYEPSLLEAKLNSEGAYRTPGGIMVRVDTIDAGADPGFADITISSCSDGDACTDDSFSNGECVNTLIT